MRKPQLTLFYVSTFLIHCLNVRVLKVIGSWSKVKLSKFLGLKWAVSAQSKVLYYFSLDWRRKYITLLIGCLEENLKTKVSMCPTFPNRCIATTTLCTLYVHTDSMLPPIPFISSSRQEGKGGKKEVRSTKLVFSPTPTFTVFLRTWIERFTVNLLYHELHHY
jgi:hypothetical protein